MQLTKSKPYLGLCSFLALVFAVASGKLVSSSTLQWVAVAGMVLSLLPSLLRKRGGGGFPVGRATLLSMLLFIAIPLVLLAAATLAGLLPGSIPFFGSMLLSVVTSFGGGEAYIAIADSTFVQAGYIVSDVFYGRIVPVANALPGPILIKVAAAVAFAWGEAQGGLVIGVLAAGIAILLTVGACSAIALLVQNFYELLKDAPVLLAIKRYILYVVCGTLLSTSIAMFYEGIKVAGEAGFQPVLTYIVMVAGTALLYLLHKRFHLHDLLLLALATGASLLSFVLV